MINWQGTVISQYNQSPTIQSLLYAINQWIDPTEDLDAFYKYIWNVDTAQGYGLDVWGRIVAVNRVLKVQVDDPYWGFDEATIVSAWPFNTTTVDPIGPQKGGIFYQNEPLTGNYILSDDGFRTLILAKALFNITSGSIPAMNQILLSLFAGVGRAYIVDNLDMSMTYKFEFVPTPVISAIVSQSGVLPRPTGVSVTYSFGPSTALPMHVGAIIGAVGLIRANPTISRRPSQLAGVGSLRASAIGVHTTNALLGGRGGVAAVSTSYQAQKVAGNARISGAGSALGIAPTQGGGRIVGTGGVRATSTFVSRLAVSLTLVGAGSLRIGASILSSPLRTALGGTGSLRANAIVMAIARTRLPGAGGVGASAIGWFPLPIHGAGSVSATASVSHGISGASGVSGTGRLSVTARGAIPGGTVVAGSGGLRAGAMIAAIGLGKVSGAGSARATATVVALDGVRLAGAGGVSATAMVVAKGGVRLAGAGDVRANATVATYDMISNGGVLMLAANAPSYPTSPAGLPSGALWSNQGIVSVVPGVTPNPNAPPVYFGRISAGQLLALGGGDLPRTGAPVGSRQLWNNGGEIAIA